MNNKDTEEFEEYWQRLELQRKDLKKSLAEMNKGVHRFRMMTDKRYKIKHWIKSFFR